MANTNTDLTEEDAADLQFPKENTAPFSNSTFYSNEKERDCGFCANTLETPYIFCPECKVNICTWCFSNGAEFLQHRNDHSYQIIRDDFAIFTSDWSAKEELALLEGLEKYGNFNLVAKDLPNRTVQEIKQHYDYYYLERHGSSELPEMKETAAAVFPNVVVPYRFKLNGDIDEPPRYGPSTCGYKYLAGYNAARSDFESDFDTNAEDLVSKLQYIDPDDPDYDLLTKLQCGIFESYNRRLKERQRWKGIIRTHGLILLRKFHMWLRRYDLTITKPVVEKLSRFMQLCSATQFETIMEGLHHSGELKIQIMRLCELRNKGITTLPDAGLYLRLKPIHEQCESELKDFISEFSLKAAKEKVEAPTYKRKTGFTPIEIVGMPGYEKLSAAERELCRNVRLVPVTYLELKDLLINENKKIGSIKLKTARKMLKIDVNKTRRLFDFLVQQGFIVKANS